VLLLVTAQTPTDRRIALVLALKEAFSGNEVSFRVIDSTCETPSSLAGQAWLFADGAVAMVNPESTVLATDWATRWFLARRAQAASGRYPLFQCRINPRRDDKR
jgi:hypothetical protein